MRSLKGTVKRYDPDHFPTDKDDKGGEWSRINDKTALRSLLNVVGVSDEGYRCLFCYMVPTSQGKAKNLSQVWSAWLPEPRTGDITLCLYHDVETEANLHPLSH